MSHRTPAKLLAIDAGNTRIKWGIHDGENWFQQGVIDTSSEAARSLCEEIPEKLEIERILVSNVAGPAIAEALRASLSILATPVFIDSRPYQCGVRNGYTEPAKLGTDRWAALIAAHAQPATQLVVMAGTALTIDALTEEGHFLGGLIVPGPQLMRAALAQGTAQLGGDRGAFQTFPTETRNAIESGAIRACVGAIHGMITALQENQQQVPRIVGSGGALQELAPHLPFPLEIKDNLVLDGLLRIAAE